MKSSLSVDSTKRRNLVLVKFNQIFYDIVFEDPESSTSVFRDENAFEDPENQIGPGNPPLYVQKVSYGRTIYFLAESAYNADEVIASFEAEADGLGGSLEVKAGLTHTEVMSNTASKI